MVLLICSVCERREARKRRDEDCWSMTSFIIITCESGRSRSTARNPARSALADRPGSDAVRSTTHLGLQFGGIPSLT